VASDQGGQGVRTVRTGLLVLPVKCLSAKHKTLLGIVSKPEDNGVGVSSPDGENEKDASSSPEEVLEIPIVLKEYIEPGSVVSLTSSVKELSYEFMIGGGFHQIKVSHSMHMGLRTIQVDGKIVDDTISGVLYDTGSEHRFKCAGFDFTFTIRLHGTFFSMQPQCFTYELLAEGYGVKEPKSDYRDEADKQEATATSPLPSTNQEAAPVDKVEETAKEATDSKEESPPEAGYR